MTSLVAELQRLPEAWRTDDLMVSAAAADRRTELHQHLERRRADALGRITASSGSVDDIIDLATTVCACDTALGALPVVELRGLADALQAAKAACGAAVDVPLREPEHLREARGWAAYLRETGSRAADTAAADLITTTVSDTERALAEEYRSIASGLAALTERCRAFQSEQRASADTLMTGLGIYLEAQRLRSLADAFNQRLHLAEASRVSRRVPALRSSGVR